MRLSEAIRLGSMLHPQGRGNYLERNPEAKYQGNVSLTVTRTCAIGAALVAVGVPENDLTPEATHEDIWPEQWNALRNSPAKCPGGCVENLHAADVEAIVYWLNDEHLWSRERIADWVAEQEERLATTAVLIPEGELILV